jgi:hypothetical protein
MRKYWEERPIYVICNHCHAQFKEKNVEFMGISENIMGEDILAFRCPNCKETARSQRRG